MSNLLLPSDWGGGTVSIMTIRERLSIALQAVAKKHLGRSADASALLGFADELIAALSGKVTLVDKAEYDRLVADARQMRRIRGHIAEYHSMLPKDKRVRGEASSPYARWAAENMKTP